MNISGPNEAGSVQVEEPKLDTTKESALNDARTSISHVVRRDPREYVFLGDLDPEEVDSWER